MRLLNTQTKELRWFGEDKRPPYAILSHKWGADEITLQEFALTTECGVESTSHPSTSKTGYRKIEGCCDQARRNGLEWAWVDTCCIDKTSSTELSEAINSMYRWYKESRVCYVYLEDVSSDDTDLSATDSSFRNSRWFSRGWTLQELIAPVDVSFFSNSWTFLGVKSDIETLLEEITGISFAFLSECGIHYFSIAQRMCWAAKRKTSRKEDMAYCLLGIFDVNMPLLYGEGDKAFQRLQEEIIKQSTDQTVFTWSFDGSHETDEANDADEAISILARSPSEFIGCADMVPYEAKMDEGFEVTQKGIRITLQFTFTGYVMLQCRSLRCIDDYAIKIQ
ncbi:HET-domain-containing protein [Annulohypoxylon truncatum]|uniref:HET-domain-containing protein n=1 Tax=Annulohypoxylon truncatum TaxID=327061 RepID=UPI002008A068|nr:HET-domain-containing protein [Annulohypoxylon truncatum]KAI1212585.1 HET-domain-containing protein [Annulohypoxylon truncatum]